MIQAGEIAVAQSAGASLDDLLRYSYSWADNPVYVIDPILDPTRGGNPNLGPAPVANIIAMPGAWFSLQKMPSSTGTTRLRHTVLVAATHERYRAIRLIAQGVLDDEGILSLNISTDERRVLNGFFPGTWPDSVRSRRAKNASALGRGHWAIRRAAEIMRENGASTLVDAASRVFKALGYEGKDHKTKAIHATNLNLWRDCAIGPCDLLQKTQVGRVIAQTLAEAANIIEPRTKS